MGATPSARRPAHGVGATYSWRLCIRSRLYKQEKSARVRRGRLKALRPTFRRHLVENVEQFEVSKVVHDLLQVNLPIGRDAVSQQLSTTVMHWTFDHLGRKGKGAPGRLAQSALRAERLQGEGPAVHSRQLPKGDIVDLPNARKGRRSDSRDARPQQRGREKVRTQQAEPESEQRGGHRGVAVPSSCQCLQPGQTTDWYLQIWTAGQLNGSSEGVEAASDRGNGDGRTRLNGRGSVHRPSGPERPGLTLMGASLVRLELQHSV